MDDKPPEHQSLARTLIDKGVLSQSQVTGILEYQCRLPPGQYMSFTDIVLEFEYMTEEQLVSMLGNQYYASKDPISQILLEQGLVSPEQLTQALAVLDSFSREHVAEVLVDMGFATRQGIEQAISQHQIQQSRTLKSLNAKEDSGLKSRLAQAFAHVENDAGASPLAEDMPAVTQNPEEEPHEPGTSSPYFSGGLEAGPRLTPDMSQVPLQQAESRVHLPLGRKLIAAGHLTESELQDALDYQERLPHVMHKPLGEILVEMGYISTDLLQDMLAEEKRQQARTQQVPKPRVGDVLLQAGVIQEWQLAHALRLQFTPAHASQKLGEILVAMGYTTREKIEAALVSHYQDAEPTSVSQSTPVSVAKPIAEVAHPTHRPLGQLLLEREYISQEQLDAALLKQKELGHEYTPLGDILVMQGHLTEAQLQEVLAAQGRFQRRPLGQVLVDMGVIEEWQLAYALCVQHSAPAEKRILLGDILLAMDYVTKDQLQAALLEQQR